MQHILEGVFTVTKPTHTHTLVYSKVVQGHTTLLTLSFTGCRTYWIPDLHLVQKYICIFKKVHSSSLSGSHPFSVWIGTREPLLTQPKRASGFFQNKETYNYLEELRLEKYECSNNKLQAKVQIRSTKLF